MNSCEPMAIAVHWLDAYRAASLNEIVAMHSADAVIECVCGCPKNIHGRKGISDYWRNRFVESPALGLEALKMDGGAVVISYRTSSGVVKALLNIADDGLITRCRCGPNRQAMAQIDWAYVLSHAATLAVAVGAIYIMLFAM